MSYKTNKKDDFFENSNVVLASLVGWTLIGTAFRAAGSCFLLRFSKGAGSSDFFVVQCFNCILFQDDGIHSAPIESIYIKRPGVFIYDYCARHGIDYSDVIEMDMSIEERVVGTQVPKMIRIACERVEFKGYMSGSSDFWEL